MFLSVPLTDAKPLFKTAAGLSASSLDKYFKSISPEQTLYVGDALYDMKSAHVARMDFANAGWGAIPSDDFSEAEFVFKQPIELANTITEL